MFKKESVKPDWLLFTAAIDLLKQHLRRRKVESQVVRSACYTHESSGNLPIARITY